MKNYCSEFIGTFALVFFGTGAVIVDQQTHGAISHAGVSITFGLVVMSMIYALGEISGAHINPAVSIAFTVAGRFPAERLPGYILSQLAGAALASFILKILFPSSVLLGSTLPAGTELQSFVLEFILSFFLMLVIGSVTSGSKEQGVSASLAISAMVAISAMFAGPICGASMNPARSFGPAIISGHLEHLWLYITAPVLGMILAVPVSKYLTKIENKT